MSLPACKYSQENGVGPMVYWAAVPGFVHAAGANLVQGLEAGGRVGGPVDWVFQDVEGETYPGGKNSYKQASFTLSRAGFNSHDFPTPPGFSFSASCQGWVSRWEVEGLSPTGITMSARRQAQLPHCFSFPKLSLASTQMGVGLRRKGAMNKRPSAASFTLWPTVGFRCLPSPSGPP